MHELLSYAVAMVRRLSIFLTVLCCGLLPLYLRASLESQRALEAAEQLRDAGRQLEAIEEYRVAIRWYAPGVSAPELALERLYDLVRTAERGSELAWVGSWAIVRGINASFSWYVPARRRDILGQIEQQLALELHRRAPASTPIHETNKPAVSYVGQLLAQICFWGWVGGVLWAIWGGLTPEGALRQRVFQRRMLLALGLLCGWLGALAMA